MTLVVATLVGVAGFVWLRPPIEDRLRSFLPVRTPEASRTWPWTLRRQQALLRRQSPGALTVLIALLDAGIPIGDAVAAAAESTQEPLRPRLRDVARAFRMGAPMAGAWQALEECDAWTPVIAAMVRSERTGASLSLVLAHASTELREERRALATVAARKAGVRAILPLVICCLPAFLALGVLPVIAAFLAPTIEGFR